MQLQVNPQHAVVEHHSDLEFKSTRVDDWLNVFTDAGSIPATSIVGSAVVVRNYSTRQKTKGTPSFEGVPLAFVRGGLCESARP